jgi:hypothetical protein
LADVVEFPEKPEPMIWVCSCGCTSFSLHNDSCARCMSCNKEADAGGWVPNLTTNTQVEASTYVIERNYSSPLFTLQSAIKNIGEVVFAVIQYGSGRQVTWSMIEKGEAEQTNWARLKMDDATRAVLKEGASKCH